MAILKFDKTELTNLDYSLKREFITTNRAGGYMSSSITCCNTRKYHGLMVCPIDKFPDQNFVLLSSLDETIMQHGQSFNLAIHSFGEIFEPKGHKYITSFEYTPTPTITYRVGGVELKKELLWLHNKEQLLIRYTLLKAKSQTTLRLRPFLAFRQSHTLSQANMFADGHSTLIEGGVKNRLYEDFPYLHIQLSCQSEFYAAPDWYKNFNYFRETERGYLDSEDLMTTGLFELDFSKNKTVVVSCSTADNVDVKNLEVTFEKELAKRSNKTEFIPCLRHSARQFITEKNGKTKMVAGFPWFEKCGRHTFMAAAWLTLTQDKLSDCLNLMRTMVSEMKDGMFQCYENSYDSVDTSLWFFNTLQQISEVTGPKLIWDEFGDAMKAVIERYAAGVPEYGIAMHENGLIWASKENCALTWMNRYADGVPVTKRDGYVVEVNAMWYNAVCYTLELATKYKNLLFIEKWKDMPEKIKESFDKTFWLRERGYFADYVNENGANLQIRPNQIIGYALPYKVMSEDKAALVVNLIERYLLTPKGIRTLAPDDADYVGIFGGNENERAKSHHQGSVRVWLLPYYFAANIALYGDQFQHKAEDIIEQLSENFLDYGIGTLSELFDGNPPHRPGGAVSHAISVGAALRLIGMIKK